jgi:hypothetical protein
LYRKTTNTLLLSHYYDEDSCQNPTFTPMYNYTCHVRWVPCHHGTAARPQVADGGDGLQIWKVAANIMNKQSRTTDKGRSSSLGVERGANNPSTSESNMLRSVSKLRRKWEDSINVDFRETGIDGGTGFSWLRIGSSGGLL